MSHDQGTGKDAATSLRVVLVRAAETEFTRAGRFQGGVDVPLTDEGREESVELTAGVAESLGRLDAVYCAADQSARETAEIVASADSNRIRILRDLKGVSFGLWEGQLLAEVKRRHGRIFEQWRRAPRTIAPPEGEEIDDAFDRAGSAVKVIAKKHREGSVAVVAPATMIALVYCRLRGLPAETVFDVEDRIGPVEVVEG